MNTPETRPVTRGLIRQAAEYLMAVADEGTPEQVADWGADLGHLFQLVGDSVEPTDRTREMVRLMLDAADDRLRRYAH